MVSKAQHEAAVNSIEAALIAFQERKANATAKAWRPEPGDTLAYEVVQLKMGADAGYGTYPIIVGKNMDTGEPVAIHAFHTMLREGLRDAGCDIGKRLITSYIGEETKNKPNAKGEFEKYHMYYTEEINLDATEVVAVTEDFTF